MSHNFQPDIHMFYVNRHVCYDILYVFIHIYIDIYIYIYSISAVMTSCIEAATFVHNAQTIVTQVHWISWMYIWFVLNRQNNLSAVLR